ncbi:MAG: hypothetical protein GXO32_00510 [Crenarchaeota archaeon]|nr:hypothetical protein [Thermoproteota archaeon]
MSWCLAQQLEVVRRVVEASRDLASGNPVASLSLLSFASERVPKLILIALGSLRCSDLPKTRSDLEDYVVKMVRKALRSIAKEVCSIDAERIVRRFNLSGEARSFVERSLSNASARARTAMQRKLSKLYEEIVRRFEELKQSVTSLEGSEVVERGLEVAASRALDVLESGFLREDEIRAIVEVASGVLSNEVDKACRRVAPRLGLVTRDLKEALEDWSDVRRRIEVAVRRAANLLKSFVAATLIMLVAARISSMVLTPASQGSLVDPRAARIGGLGEASEVLMRCSSALS